MKAIIDTSVLKDFIEKNHIQYLVYDGNNIEQFVLDGSVIWVSSGNVALKVEKITSNTYAGETLYENEEFILLDIYPKTNGTVKVTYGDLTKTIVDTSGVEEPNAQQVFFGTFNGTADSVTTPASGELIIEGDYYAFGQGVWKTENKGASIIPHQPCITEIKSWGNITKIPSAAFARCASLTSVLIPSRVTSIGANAFAYCTELTNVTLPEGITEIPMMCFTSCSKLANINCPNTLTSIGISAFNSCGSLTSIVIPDSVTSIGDSAFNSCTSLILTELPNGIVSIGPSAFYNCLNINITAFPEGLTSIGADAFHMATNKADTISMYENTITFPSTLTSVGARAFRYDRYSGSGDYFFFTYVKTAVMLPTTPPTLGEDAFGNSGTLSNSVDDRITIIVPKGYGETYKAAEDWNNYASRIVEAS